MKFEKLYKRTMNESESQGTILDENDAKILMMNLCGSNEDYFNPTDGFKGYVAKKLGFTDDEFAIDKIPMDKWKEAEKVSRNILENLAKELIGYKLR